MAMKDWFEVIDEYDYTVWENTNNGKRISVFKNQFITPSGRRQTKKSKSQAIAFAKSYMRSH